MKAHTKRVILIGSALLVFCMVALLLWKLPIAQNENDVNSKSSERTSISTDENAPEKIAQRIASLSPEPSSEEIREAVSTESLMPLKERIAAIHAQHDNLSNDDFHALMALVGSKEDILKMHYIHEHVLKDFVMSTLASHPDTPAIFTHVLIDIYSDSTNDLVIRDYALQYLSRFHARMDDPLLAEMVFWEATKESNDMIGGTALLALERIVTSSDKISPQGVVELLSVAEDMINSYREKPMSATTALQVASNHQWNEAVPIARKLAVDQEASLPLRLSALNYLLEREQGTNDIKTQLQDESNAHLLQLAAQM